MQLRMTNQREVILQELTKSCAHLTADDLYDLVRKQVPRISLATVYRNLEILSERGVIVKLGVGGRQNRYDADTSLHHHIHCVKCYRVDNLDGYTSEVEMNDMAVHGQYVITGYRLDVSGICPECAKKEQQ